MVLNSPVQRIARACVKWSDRQADGCERSVMRVTKEDGSVVEADMVVMAVPLGVLQSGSIEFKDDTACAVSALDYTGQLAAARRPPAVFQAERDRRHRLRQHQQAVPPLRRRRLHPPASAAGTP